MTSLLPVATLIVGALLGFLSTLYVTSRKHRNEIELRIIDQYLEVRRDLVGVVSGLTFLEEPLGDKERLELQKAVSGLFYKNFDFLPRSVLDALALLRVSLEKYNGVIYGIKDGAVTPLKKPEIAALIDRCSLFKNAKFFVPIALSSEDADRRAAEAVKLQARNVLSCLNEKASIKDFLLLARKLKKNDEHRGGGKA